MDLIQYMAVIFSYFQNFVKKVCRVGVKGFTVAESFEIFLVFKRVFDVCRVLQQTLVKANKKIQKVFHYQSPPGKEGLCCGNFSSYTISFLTQLLSEFITCVRCIFFYSAFRFFDFALPKGASSVAILLHRKEHILSCYNIPVMMVITLEIFQIKFLQF